VNVVAAILAVALAMAAAIAWRARRRYRRAEAAFETASQQLEVMQTAFHQFVPHRVVDDIVQRGVSIRGERREATVMFADLVGFTSMSERLDAEHVVRILNGYFQSMSEEISRHNGHVAKFMGDGIMAIFGAPEPNPWHAMDSVRAALAMRTAVVRYNEKLRKAGDSPIRVSIGLHSGLLVAGVIGSAQLIEYTVIGDVVNTAARVEGLTRMHGTDILITAAVRAALDERFSLHEMPATDVKGKAERLATFTVDGFIDDADKQDRAV
jgi:adenylate cyclase